MNRITFSLLRNIVSVLLIILSFNIYAQEKVVNLDSIFVKKPIDKSFVKIKETKTAVSDLKKKTEYQYAEENLNMAENWWEQLKRKFYDWLDSFFGDKKYGTTRKYLSIAFIVLAAIFVIMKLIGIDMIGLFRKNTDENDIEYTTTAEHIHGRNFNAEIDVAIQNGNYRLAIRLLYLKSLKELADLGLINWQITRTNRSYFYELKPGLQPSFEQITKQFEYAWYGDFDVNEQDYLDIKQDFEHFNRTLKS
jgi:hypothetical protein